MGEPENKCVVFLCGKMSIWRGGRAIEGITGKPALLLASVALAPHMLMKTRELEYEIWGNPRRGASFSSRRTTAVATLNKKMGKPHIITNSQHGDSEQCTRINASSITLDCAEFRATLKLANGVQATTAELATQKAGLLIQALALHTREGLLPGPGWECLPDRLSGYRNNLRADYSKATIELANLYANSAQHELSIELANRLLNPPDEMSEEEFLAGVEACRLLLYTHAHTGRPTNALQTYRAFRRHLRKGHTTDKQKELEWLAKSIRTNRSAEVPWPYDKIPVCNLPVDVPDPHVLLLGSQYHETTLNAKETVLLAEALPSITAQRTGCMVPGADIKPEEARKGTVQVMDGAVLSRPGPLLPISPTPFFGRENEMRDLSDLLSSTATELRECRPLRESRRIHTITGTGGTGKTRLACEVANRVRMAFQEAVLFIDLTATNEAVSILSRIAEALSLPAAPGSSMRDQVVYALAERPFLLVLDNFEHLLSRHDPRRQGWRIVQDLIYRCPTLICLITSREKLSMDGEYAWPLRPLHLPEAEATTEALLANPCVRLFADRAHATLRGFTLDTRNVHAVASLCRALDGLPLAIELAAARTNVMTPEEMLADHAARLEWLESSDRNRPARHLSLRAMLDASYDLLPPDVQPFFTRLSVFTGGWEMEAACTVCAAGESKSARNYMQVLVDCSLVVSDSSEGRTRFSMLETVRQYSAERLGECRALRNTHQRYYFTLVERAHPELHGSDSGTWKRRLQAEHANIYMAIEMASDEAGDEEGALRAAARMSRYWRMRGNVSEGYEILKRVLMRNAANANETARATALNGAGSLAFILADYQASGEYYAESSSIARTSGDELALSIALRGRGHVVIAQGKYKEARGFFEDSLAIARRLAHEDGVALSLLHLSVIHYVRGECPESQTLVKECSAIWKRIGSTNYTSALYQQALICFSSGDDVQAAACAAEADAQDRLVGTVGMASALLGRISIERGNYSEAERLLEEQLRCQRRIGNKVCLATVLKFSGLLAMRLGDLASADAHFASADAHFAESLCILRDAGHKYDAILLLREIAKLKMAEGDARRAVRLFGATAALHEALGTSVPPAEREGHQVNITTLRDSLLLEVFEREWQSGSEMSHDEAIDYALGSVANQELTRDVLPPTVAPLPPSEHRLCDLDRPETSSQPLQPDLPTAFPLRNTPDNSEMSNNLPVQVTSFIGREKEIAEVQLLLSKKRLLTLTGCGGCGKTSFALQVVAAVRNDYPQGVWFVELAALTDQSLAEHVAQSITKAIGLPEEPGTTLTQTLVNYCRSRKLLLVIDNCEHVIEAGAQLIDALLRSCPELKILATSRESLKIDGEQEYRIPTLSFPNPTQPQTPETLRSYEASRLFIERAITAEPDFAVTAKNAVAIGRICYRLDGIPLALELAAAHVRGLSVEQIEARLQDRFRLLKGGKRTALPRQQTLYASIDWSYGLLTASEKILLNRLSVFAGGWTLEAAEEIGGDASIENSEVYGLLTSLVAKSLVQAKTVEETIRYRLLETIREYARKHLIDDEEKEALTVRHATYFLSVGEEGEAGLYGREQQSWLNRLENEHNNFRTALTWCASAKGEPEIGIRLVGALGRFWWLRGYLAEGRTYLDTFLTLTGKSGAPAERARAMNAAASLAYRAGDIAAAKAFYQQSLDIVPEHNADDILCVALRGFGHLEFIDEHVDSALKYMDLSLTAANMIGSKKDIMAALEQKGYILFHGGDSDARSLLEECVRLSRGSGHSQALSSALYTLGQLEMAEGDYTAAKELNAEAYDIDRILKTPAAVAFGVLGTIAMIEKDFPEAQRIFTIQLERLRAADSPLPLASTLRNAASVELCVENYPSAASMLEEGLIIVRDKNWQRGMAEFLDSFGCLAAAQGQNERAAQLWGAASARRSSTKQATAYHEYKQREEYMSLVERRISAPVMEALKAKGHEMSSDDAIAYALQVDATYA